MDVEDIFTEFKEELLQTLNEHQGASVIDRGMPFLLFLHCWELTILQNFCGLNQMKSKC